MSKMTLNVTLMHCARLKEFFRLMSIHQKKKHLSWNDHGQLYAQCAASLIYKSATDLKAGDFPTPWKQMFEERIFHAGFEFFPWYMTEYFMLNGVAKEQNVMSR